MARIAITENDLVEALAAAIAPPPPKEALTSRELAALTGWSRDKVEDAIGRLAMQDRIGLHRKQVPDVAGKLQWRPAYTILPAKKK